MRVLATYTDTADEHLVGYKMNDVVHFCHGLVTQRNLFVPDHDAKK